ncbi:hypothetical protein BpHYR1_019351 [Brachionus plicatilis]|uniref:Uncharacterized protein n=1 Tax=Brachionus plicatilis TaxID=10195 RepID=A0A3M7QNK5_BRAPC|nr:hypothetical protein BpHYR1_019351 [Brachionus plicatilis]
MDFDPFIVSSHRTLIDPVVGCQTVEAFQSGSLYAKRFGKSACFLQNIFIKNYDAERALKLVLKIEIFALNKFKSLLRIKVLFYLNSFRAKLESLTRQFSSLLND